MKKLISFVLKLGLLSLGSAFAEPLSSAKVELVRPSRSIRCPEPQRIVMTPVPRSLNAVYTADSQGVAFMGYNLGGLPTPMMEFRQATIVRQEHELGLVCSYAADGMHLDLATQEAILNTDCHFLFDLSECIGSLEECQIVCL